MRAALFFGIGMSMGCSNMDSAGDMSFGEASPGEDTLVEPGTLTAGAWDDNLNYDVFQRYLDDTAALQMSGAPRYSTAEHDAAWARAQDRSPRRLLDISLVVDTTGSMGDELGYLQVEFEALAAQITQAHPDAEQRWSLVLYRDLEDAYLTEVTPFTADLDAFQASLKAGTFDGGGDYPEAPDAGLQEALALEWREGGHARLVFWIADAPHHDEQRETMTAVIQEAAARDVHIYPIAASGADDLTEYTMRTAAQLTLGRYLFLTDDSGVGNPHKEPDIPCYYVTTLSDAVLRMVDIELSGEYREPTEEEIIRVGGDLADGACVLEDGEVVQGF